MIGIIPGMNFGVSGKLFFFVACHYCSLYRRGFITSLYTLNKLACFMRKRLIFFAGFCRKVLCNSKIKNLIFLGHNKIVQTELMLSGPAESGSSFKFADFKASMH